MNTIEKFIQAVQASSPKKPYLGWLCTYTPVEIFHAARFTPFGIKKSFSTESQDVYLGHNLCPYVHSVFGDALQGRYGFLEGVVIAHSCECFRRLYDGWLQFKERITPGFSYLLNVPTIRSPNAIDYFEQSLRQLITSLEEQFNVNVTEDALHESIAVYNRMRRLMQKLYRLRMLEPAPISGSQVLEILDLAMTSVVEDFNCHLESLLETLAKDDDLPATSTDKQRLLVFGSVFNPEIIRFIEGDEIGGMVVCENACNGLRFIETTVEPTDNPLGAIASGYLKKAPCPRMANENVTDRLCDLIDRYSIDGVIYYIPKYCENLYLDYPLIREKLDQIDIPHKRLEGGISGDFNKTELRSFIETIALKKEMKDFA